jgi:hypothetical protein
MSDTILIINLHLINVNYKQSQTHELCQYSNNDHVGGETNVKNNMSGITHYIVSDTINIREYRRGNQKWTISRN